MGPIRRAWIVLGVAALVSAAAPTVASADEPDITRAPSLTGSALVGSRLDAVGYSWRAFPAATASWSWLRCDTDSLWSCGMIDGATASFYTVTSSDLGKRLRALLLVSNRDGRDYAWSSATLAVAAPPPPTVTPAPVPEPVPQPAPPPPPVVAEAPAAVPPAPAAPKLMVPEPLVRVRGWLTTRGARITMLSVRAPRGAKISVSCSGIGCPRVAPAGVAKRTRLRAYEGMFRAGTLLVISVTRPGFVGKHTQLRIRRGKAPLRRDRCLYPGSGEPTACLPA